MYSYRMKGFLPLCCLITACTSPGNYRYHLPAKDFNNVTVQPARVSEVPLPEGYKRILTDEASFGDWLRQVQLKKDKTVYLYNGQKKVNQSAQYAVLDILVSYKDLQQCADAVMRLRAEYLFSEKKYNEIVFTDNAGKKYSFSTPYTYAHFLDFMEIVFGMCGSASLSKQLKAKQLNEMVPGDVLIHSGFPGHAVIVMILQ